MIRLDNHDGDSNVLHFCAFLFQINNVKWSILMFYGERYLKYDGVFRWTPVSHGLRVHPLACSATLDKPNDLE